jgi:membrane dipeptidase
MAGDALHVGIGSDFDGGFGLSSVPVEIDTIADIRKIIPILIQKGYTETDITSILGGNWLVHLQNTLPEVL